MESGPAAGKSGTGLRLVANRSIPPSLKGLIAEATQALAHLDAERLEELAISCQTLNRDMKRPEGKERLGLVRQAREATCDMAIFARVLEATRGNLEVMNRLRELREGRLEYGGSLTREWVRTESKHGNN
jgi:hypothetical protein